MKILTKLEIIDEVASFYNLTNRAKPKNSTVCVYTYHNKHCAVGRYLLPKYQTTRFKYNRNWNVQVISNAEKLGLDSLLIEKVRGHSLDFWIRLQTFHDNDVYWTNEGLSHIGKIEANRLKEIYKD